MGIHVVVGANGATGTVLCRELLAAGHTVRAVSRSGRGAPSGVDEIAADATDAVRITEICAGATSLYHCALPPMGSWLPTYVDLTRSLITAAGNVGARLVYADDTWMYGKVNGPMREDSPVRPVAYKGALRALAAEMIASAYARGQTESVVGRAAELYGPRVESLLGAGVFAAGITVMSTMDNLHTKGWLQRERDGKAYRYWASLSREQHSAQLMSQALDTGGKPDLVLTHFLEQIGPEESARLRAMLRQPAKRTRRT